MESLIGDIRAIAGSQRCDTFALAASASILLKAKTYVETGVFRGIPFDGQSTLIWAKLAKETGGNVFAIDISPDSIARARELLGDEYAGYVTLIQDDSLNALDNIPTPIDVLYLDSFDHDPSNPEPCQKHQLNEATIAIPKMADKSIIILDDCEFDTGGKSKLSDPYIIECGWKCITRQYQNVYQRGCDNLF